MGYIKIFIFMMLVPSYRYFMVLVYRIFDAGCRMPDAGCRMPDAGCRMPDAGCRMPDAGCRMPDAGCRMPDVGCRMPDAGCRIFYVMQRVPSDDALPKRALTAGSAARDGVYARRLLIRFGGAVLARGINEYADGYLGSRYKAV
ncbi:hypothetical protein NMD73_11235 [Edwardsiella tarda]|uniref:hypothetical protein n=1 Tax=Edwardsiella tarda TaxID=636 RepID=UPI00351C9884